MRRADFQSTAMRRMELRLDWTGNKCVSDSRLSQLRFDFYPGSRQQYLVIEGGDQPWRTKPTGRISTSPRTQGK